MWFRRTKASPNSLSSAHKGAADRRRAWCICVSVFVLFVCSTKSEQNHSRTIQDGLKLCSLHASLPQANSSVSLHQGGASPGWSDPTVDTTVSLQPMPTYWYYVIAGGGAIFLLGCVTLVMVLCCHRYHLAAKKSQHSVVLPEHVHGTVHRRRVPGVSLDLGWSRC